MRLNIQMMVGVAARSQIQNMEEQVQLAKVSHGQEEKMSELGVILLMAQGQK